MTVNCIHEVIVEPPPLARVYCGRRRTRRVVLDRQPNPALLPTSHRESREEKKNSPLPIAVGSGGSVAESMRSTPRKRSCSTPRPHRIADCLSARHRPQKTPFRVALVSFLRITAVNNKSTTVPRRGRGDYDNRRLRRVLASQTPHPVHILGQFRWHVNGQCLHRSRNDWLLRRLHIGSQPEITI